MSLKKFFAANGSRSLEQKFKEWHRLGESFEEVVKNIRGLKNMDNFGCADRWPGFVADELANAFRLLVAFCDEIDDCVGRNQGAAGTADDDLDGDSVVDDFFVDLLVGLLQERAATIVGEQVRSDKVRDGIAAALKGAVLHGERTSLGFEFDADGDEDGIEVRTYGNADLVWTVNLGVEAAIRETMETAGGVRG